MGSGSKISETASMSANAEYRKVSSQFYAPPSQFDGCFTTFYRLKLDITNGGKVTDYLQPEWANIRFFAGSAPTASLPGGSSISDARFAATGPSSRPAYFELGPSRMWGIGFLPLGWARFVDTPAAQLANVVCDGSRHPAFAKFDCLSEVLCDASVSEQEQFEHIVDTLGKMMRPSRDEAKIVAVHRVLIDAKLSSVTEFADRAGFSVRTLERLCHRYFGFSPKLLMRRQRFMRSLAEFLLHDGKRWTEVMDENYHDQAQFSREFREFMTMNPTEYAALEHPVLAAFMEARAKIWGSPAQTLDQPK